MTPGDVTDQIIADPRLTKFVNLGERIRQGLPLGEQDDTGIAIHAWCTLVEGLKPEQGYMPMSPTEIERAKRILRVIAESLDAAKALNRSHFRPVEDGGR
jgi:hypothetical protein